MMENLPWNVKFYDVVDIDVDPAMAISILTDKGTNRIRKIDMKTGAPYQLLPASARFGFDGDGKLAVQSMLNVPESAVVDSRRQCVYFRLHESPDT